MPLNVGCSSRTAAERTELVLLDKHMHKYTKRTAEVCILLGHQHQHYVLVFPGVCNSDICICLISVCPSGSYALCSIVNRQAICMDNSAAGAGEGLPAGVEPSGLQSTGASQHATGYLV